jgi:hypothetical protein
MSTLTPDATAALNSPDSDRVHFILRDQWIGYTAATEGLAELNFVATHPKVHRMPNRLLVSESNNGKTALIQRFISMHASRNDPSEEAAVLPILSVQAPPEPDERRFYTSLLDAAGMIHNPRHKTGELFYQIRTVLPKLSLKVIIIDEIHHIIAGTGKRHRAFLNTLKYLGNELMVPFIIVGTREAFNALQADPQVANRFPPIELPRWQCDNELRQFLVSFEMTLPLKRFSDLSDPRMTTRLHSMAEGTVGEMSSLLKKAAIESIRGGEERICDAVLDRLRWVPPSHRRNHALAVI